MQNQLPHDGGMNSIIALCPLYLLLHYGFHIAAIDHMKHHIMCYASISNSQSIRKPKAPVH